MDVGRRQNADPRWILPLLCRRGHITRNEVGAIRIAANETHFQIPRAIADLFVSAVQRTAGSEDGGDVAIEVSPETPRDTARQNRQSRTGNDTRPRPVQSAGGEGKKPWHKKPHRKGPKPR